MKKILSLLFVSVIAFMAVSCYPEDLTVFDTGKAVAPVLGSYEVGEKMITASYTPGSFNQDFNKAIAPNHFFVITKVDDRAVSKAVTTSSSDGVLSASVSGVNNALISLGYQEGSVLSFEMRIRASMQTNAGDNGRNGYVDSDGTISVSGFEIAFPQGSPYQDYTETSPFGVTGSLSAYGISWDGDLEMWMTPDGSQHVAKSVTIESGDEFKFRRDQEWAVNYGGSFSGIGNDFAAEQDGGNIVVPAGVYDLWLDIAAGTITVTEAYNPYPDHTQASAWSIIGSLSAYGISWDGDIAMTTDGSTHVAQAVRITASDEFKFRKDQDWAVNFGGAFGSLGGDFAVVQDGDNIVIGADGVYDLILNPDAGTAQIVETLGGGVSGKIGGNDAGGGDEDPGTEPEPVTGWNIIGLNGDWSNDILATADGNVYTAYINAPEATSFKWRLDGGWDADFGGTFVTAGEAFEAVPGGPNIEIGAGFWKVVLDLDAAVITVSEGIVWSLIGDFNGWGGDVDMVESDGKWVSPVTYLTANGFKIRYNHDWTTSVGGSFAGLGIPFEAVSENGPNIELEEDGYYTVTYDPEAAAITVEKGVVWSLIGVNGDWDNDIRMKLVDGIWVSPTIEISGEFKLRQNFSWDENRGGEMAAVGEAFAVTNNGSNISVAAGTYTVYYDPENETVTVK